MKNDFEGLARVEKVLIKNDLVLYSYPYVETYDHKLIHQDT